MLVVTVIFGSVLGLFAGLTAYFALGLGALAAFGLYLACAVAPALISVALTAAHLAADQMGRTGLTIR